MNLDQLIHENDIELLGLVKKLKLYASKVDNLIQIERQAGRETDPDMSRMWSDLTTAAGIINHITRIRDDYL